MQDTPGASGSRSKNGPAQERLKQEAEAAGVDVDQAIESALREAIARQNRWRQWRAENRAAIESSNAELEANGLWYAPDWLSQ